MPRKIKSFGRVASYTVSGTVIAKDFIREQLNKNIPELPVDEDGLRPKTGLEELKKTNPGQYSIEKERLLPQEVAYIEKNWKKILDDAVENRPEVTTKPFTKSINNYLTKIIPGYKPLTGEEQKQREAISDAMRKKFTSFSTRLSMVTQMVEVTPPDMTRTEQTMLRPDLSEEGMRFNREVKEAVASKDPRLMANVIGQAMEKLANVDYEHMDLTDDQYIVDHFEELEQVLSTGTEIKSLVDTYQKYVEIEDNEETREAFARLNAVQDIAGPLRIKVDAMCSPLYSQVRVEQLQTSYRPMLNNYPDPIEALFGSKRTMENGHYLESMENVGNSQVIFNQTPFMRKDLTPWQRMEEHRRNFNDPKQKGTYNIQIKPGKQEEKDSSLEAVESVQEGNQVQEETAEDRRTRERLQAYEQKFRQNLQVIRKAVPGFWMTEREIKEYVSPERLKFQDAMQSYTEQRKEVVKGIGKVPVSLERSMFAILDKSGTPEAKKNNDELVGKLKDDSAEGLAYRKELFAKLANRVSKLDDKMLSPTAPTNEKLKYIQEHMDDIKLGYEFQNNNKMREATLGIKLSETDEMEMTKLQDRAVDLGGFGDAYPRLVDQDAFMTMPFDKLTTRQAEQVLQYVSKHVEELDDPGKDVNAFTALFTFRGTVEKNLTTEKPAKEVFSAEDFGDAIPSVGEMKRQLDEMYKGLQEANHWYSRNSTEYENLLTSIEKCSAQLDKVDGEFTAYPKELQQSMENVFNAAKDYHAHVGDKAKNETQQKRRDIADNLQKFLTPLHGNPEHFNMFVDKQNRACAQKQSESIQQEENPVTAEEQRFNDVARRTDHLRQEAEKLPDGILKKISLHQAESRDDLLNYVGRRDLDMNTVKPLVAKVIVGTRLKLLGSRSDKPLSADNIAEKYDRMAKALENSEPFNRAFSKMKPEDLMGFLEGPGEKNMAAAIDAGMKTEKQGVEAVNQPKTEKVVQEASKQAEQSNASMGGLQ